MTTDDNPSIPHNIEAEQQLLGALLLSNDRLDRITDLIRAEHFYEPLHADIFDRIVGRVNAGQMASPVTLRSDMQNNAALKDVGGPAYLVRLAGASVSAFAARDYAQTVVEAAAKRKLIEIGQRAQELIETGEQSAAEIAIEIETAAGAVAASSEVRPLVRSHVSTVTGAVREINNAYAGTVPPGISTGIPQLDSTIGFMRPGNLLVVAGRPSMGKTTLAQNLAYSAASAGVGVFFGSFEMLGEELTNRFLSLGLASRGEALPYTRMIRGEMSEAEMRLVVDESRRQMGLPIHYAEREARDMRKLRSAIRRARQVMSDTEAPLGLIVIDYIQQLTHPQARSVYDRASMASDFAKGIAMDFGVPVVALAQLSREVERRDPPVPMLSDLRESGKIEEDADVVIFTYRDAYYLQRKLDALGNKDVERENDIRLALSNCRNNIDLIVAKQRSGATKTVQAYIRPDLCQVSKDKAEFAGELI